MSEFQWYRAYDKLNVSVYIVDAETYEILYMNDRLKSKLKSSHVGDTCYRVFCGMDAPCAHCLPISQLKQIEDNVFTESVQSYNSIFDVYLDVYERIVDWENGRKARLLIAIDVSEITREKKHLENLKSAFSIYQTLVGSADLLFFALDSDQRFIYVNNVFCERTGYKLGTGDFFPIRQLCNKEDTDDFYKCFPAVFAGETARADVLIHTAGGETLPVRFSAFPIRDENGTIYAFAAIGQDISAETMMESTAEWQRAILDNTTDYLACFDQDVRVRYCNPALADITGWKPGDQASGAFLMTQESSALGYGVAIKQALQGESWEGEVVLRNTNGAQIPVSAKLFPIFGKAGEISGIAVTMSNQTAQHALLDAAQKKLRNQEFITKFSTPFTQPYQFEELIGNALRELREFLNTSRASLLEFDEDGALRCTFEDRADASVYPTRGCVYKHEDAAGLYDILQHAPFYYVQDTTEFFKEFPAFANRGKSVCYIPLLTEGKHIGYLVFASMTEKAVWEEDAFRLVLMAVSTIAGAYATRSNAEISRRAKERLEVALEVASTGVWEMFPGKQIISFDHGFKRLLQVPMESPVDLPVWVDYMETLVDREQYKEFYAYLRAFDGSKPVAFRNREYTFPDGSVKYMNSSSRTYLDSAGKPERLVGMLWDVTDEVKQRRKEEKAQKFMADFAAPFLRPYVFDTLIVNALQELNRYFDSERANIFLVEGSSYCCKFSCTTDPAIPTVTGVSFPLAEMESLTRVLESEPDYYIDDTAAVQPRTPDMNYGAKSACYLPLAVDSKLMGYLVLSTHSRAANWTDAIFQPAVMAASIVNGAIVTHQATVSLEKAQERLQMAISSTNIGIWEISVPDQTISFDEGTARLFRVSSPSPMRLKEWADHLATLLDAGEYGEYLDYLGGRYDGSRSDAFEKLKVCFADGTVQYTTNTVRQINSAQGKPDRVIGMTWDVTNDVLLLKRLEQTTQQAAEASNAKSEFLSRRSHELRTPLNAIAGMVRISETTDNPAELKSYLEQIKTASGQLLAIVNDVLDISKIESGKVDLEIAPFSLESCIEKSCSLVADKIAQKKLRFHYHRGKGLHWWYCGDELRVSQILINLLSNAVKFTPDGGEICIHADGKAGSDGMTQVRIAVSDNGIGMTQEQCGRVFGAFEQADNTTTRKYGGTGLGLAISKNLVEKMGGTITVVSQPDAGSTFTVTLPMQHDPQTEAERIQNAMDKAQGLRVLLGSRNAETVEPFRLLQPLLHWTLDVVDGEKEIGRNYLERARDSGQPYDLLFADSDMMSAYIRERLYSDENLQLPATTVYITEIGEWNKVQSEAAEYGINRFISKPLTTFGIVSLIVQINEDNSRSPALARQAIDLSSLRVLLTEDIEINRIIVRSLLGNLGVQLDEAENGEEAVEMFTRQPDRYDLILMDVQMPKLNGFDATRKIRALGTDKARHIPIIALTASAFKEDVEECLAAGMNDHVAKPIDFEKLLEKIHIYTGV